MAMKVSLTLILAGMLIFLKVSVFAESLTFVNRSGQILETIQVAPDGVENWSDDLIPSKIILDGESVLINLRGEAPWSFRLIDSMGTPYVLYDANPGISGKIVVGPEHQARLSHVAGSMRRVKILNITDYSLVGFKVSKSSASSWGSDLLNGRTVPPGESMEVTLSTEAGSLSFDVQYRLANGMDTFSLEQSSLMLTDRASLVLQIPAQ